MTASKMHLLVLVHLRILNWLVVNSPRTVEQRVIPDKGPVTRRILVIMMRPLLALSSLI